MKRFFIASASLVLVFFGADIAHADTIGQTQIFRVNQSYDMFSAQSVQATMRAAGQHGYWYVDNRYWDALTADQQQRFSAALNNLSVEFDTVIYPRETAFWGTENTPGVDGDPHVVILLERLVPGNGGYFETIHNYPRERAPDSNAHEMIFASAESVLTLSVKDFVVHEFQHLISFNQKELMNNVREDVWLNEARSEYAVTLAGYSEPFASSTLQRRALFFMRNASDSLVEWPNTPIDYGIASVFMHYLVDQYGPGIASDTMRTSSIGAVSIDEWLVRNATNKRFGDAYVDWMIASYLNDRSIGPRYGYTTDGLRNLHVAATVGLHLDDRMYAELSTSLKEWQPFWAEISMPSAGILPKTVSIRVSGTSSLSLYGTALALYRDNTIKVVPLTSAVGVASGVIQSQINGEPIVAVTVVATHGSLQPVGSRTIMPQPITITVAASIPSPTPDLQITDGDLIRRIGESEIYVVWGPYRRYLPEAVLQLYGFQNRPVHAVSNEIFSRYRTSNYVREIEQKKVYALWPDGTKHWLNITPEQWDASGRDWGAIFTVNTEEVNWYGTGADIVE